MGLTSRERRVYVSPVSSGITGRIAETNASISWAVREWVISRAVKCMRCGGMSQRSSGRQKSVDHRWGENFVLRRKKSQASNMIIKGKALRSYSARQLVAVFADGKPTSQCGPEASPKTQDNAEDL